MSLSLAQAIQSVEAPKQAMAGQNLNITPGTDMWAVLPGSYLMIGIDVGAHLHAECKSSAYDSSFASR